ncbi:acetate--CoA ligase family protein [Streptomyces sp. NBC_01775]|uniref:acetate--CoA ligase family protein n=1 Tax=Streptomyces sp. NBC_01775 TaxID=2975939 RepID=UPI002DDAAD35|nr:acetate--CoA ligase family protein [Streptomyces sp. NBC_01775]WSB74354.1 acetate--CoA ligase family protein [Streptomyces sp. NBC_01775]
MSAVPSTPVPTGFEHAFRPRSVAVIGASDDPGRISGRALHYLRRAGYQGAIYPVNHKRTTVQGLAAYPSLGAVPEVPDVALIALPSGLLKQAVTDCVAKGVGAAVIYAAGFAETGEDGQAVQEELAGIARRGNLRLFGPNCLGLLHAASGFVGTFSSAFDEEIPPGGSVAVVSQSGAYGGHLAYLCRRRNVGVGYWVSTGNEAGTDVAECIHWLALQDDVSVILAYAEGVRDAGRLRTALAVAHEQRKPVVFMKVGSSSAGAAAAQSHTASLVGSDAVHDALFRQYGVHRARTTQEQVDLAYACSRGVLPAGRRVGIVTVSGGFGVQLCDAAERYGLDVAGLPDQARARLRGINPMGSDDNPCDTTAGWLNDMSLITDTFGVMYAQGDYDSVIGSFTMLPDSPTYGEGIKEAIRKGTSDFMDRPTVLCMEARPEVVRSYEDAGFLVYDDSERAVATLDGLARLREGFERPLPASGGMEALRSELPGGPLSEAAAQELLASAGVPFPASKVVTSAAEAAEAAVRIGLPVVMKIVSPDIPHKTEIAGVVLGVTDADAAAAQFTVLTERAATARPDARVEGVLVSRTAPRGAEVIVGARRDPVFGPVVMFGTGGVQAELFRDVATRVGAVDRAEALQMIAETRGHALLTGFRGLPHADVDAIADLLVTVSAFAVANADRIETLELNPVVVREAGQGVLALDALVVPRQGTS